MILQRNKSDTFLDLSSFSAFSFQDLGYDEEQGIQLLEKYNTVQAVITARGKTSRLN